MVCQFLFFKYLPLITPALRYLWMSNITRPPLMTRDSTSILLLWHTVPKNFSKSISTTCAYSTLTFRWHCFSASCAPLFDQKPKLFSENCFSKIDKSTCVIASWNTRSTTVGIPSFRDSPFTPFGISTLRTGWVYISHPLILGSVAFGYF